MTLTRASSNTLDARLDHIARRILVLQAAEGAREIAEARRGPTIDPIKLYAIHRGKEIPLFPSGSNEPRNALENGIVFPGQHVVAVVEVRHAASVEIRVPGETRWRRHTGSGAWRIGFDARESGCVEVVAQNKAARDGDGVSRVLSSRLCVERLGLEDSDLEKITRELLAEAKDAMHAWSKVSDLRPEARAVDAVHSHLTPGDAPLRQARYRVGTIATIMPEKPRWLSSAPQRGRFRGLLSSLLSLPPLDELLRADLPSPEDFLRRPVVDEEISPQRPDGTSDNDTGSQNR